jgi:hypothetical protein
MARSLDCVPRKLGCRNCKCGNHRGCVAQPKPPKFNGATVPSQLMHGTPVQGCPCIKADDAKKKKAEAKEIAENKAAKLILVRIAAIETALWGKSYEGKLTTVRPKTTLIDEEDAEAPVRKRTRK